jgi:hypothetical protein
MQNQTIDHHLREALAHLEQAINQSIHTVLENQASSKEIGSKWEQFLGEFYGMVKDKGKRHGSTCSAGSLSPKSANVPSS